MSTAANDLDFWSDDINVEVLTPLMILRAQEPYLRKKTKGILVTKVESTSTESGMIHNLYLVAPALGNYKERILSVKHKPELVYPCESSSWALMPPEEVPSYTEADFMDLLKKLLQSPRVRATIDSLLAKSNELRSQAPNAAALSQNSDSP